MNLPNPYIHLMLFVFIPSDVICFHINESEMIRPHLELNLWSG